MSCRDPWACNQPCDGTCQSSPYGRVLTLTSGARATMKRPRGGAHRLNPGPRSNPPRGNAREGPDMQNTQQSPPTPPRREKWRLIGRRPIKGHGAMGDFYLWERDEPGALYPMRYGIPIGQFWVRS